jgi:hypothetical protein
VRKLKAGAGPDLVLMGSGSIVSQLTNARLIDEVQEKMPLTLKSSRVFGNGNVLLSYTRAAWTSAGTPAGQPGGRGLLQRTGPPQESGTPHLHAAEEWNAHGPGV